MDTISGKFDTKLTQSSAGKENQYGLKKSGFNLEAYYKKK